MNDFDQTITLIAVGDISFHGICGNLLSSENRENLKMIKPCFQDGDLIFGNLETVIGKKGTKSNKLSVLLTSNASAVSTLKDLGFNILNMANNHIMDMGSEGLFETMSILDNYHISYVGVGKNIDEASKMEIINIKGRRIGFLGFCQDDEGCTATQERAGGAPLKEELVHEIIKKQRSQVDYFIVSLHMGMEFTAYPSPRQIKMCRNIIDMGVDIILGHHPHVPQGYERYKHGLIIYSLGNFIFDMFDSSEEKIRSGYIYTISIEKSSIDVNKITPFRLDDNCMPQILNGEEHRRSISYLMDISRQLSNQKFIRLYWYKMSRWYLMNIFKGLYYQVVKKKRFKAPFVFLQNALKPETRYTLLSGMISIFIRSSFGSINKYKIPPQINNSK